MPARTVPRRWRGWRRCRRLRRRRSKRPCDMALKPAQQAAEDAAANAQKLLLLLAADWLNNDRTHAGEIAGLLADVVADLGPPTNRDVPYASQSGQVLHCTMGNWDGEPVSYAYAWHSDGAADGTTGAERA